MWFEGDLAPRKRRRRKTPMLKVSAGKGGKRRDPAKVGVMILAPIIVVGGLVLVGFGLREGGRALFSRNPVFTIRRLEVLAASRRTKDLAREYTEIQEGMNLFAFNIGKVRDRVMANAPNFRSMSISRRLPDKVIIEVVERSPLARIGSRGDYVADAEGHVFVQRSGLSNLPSIRGFSRRGLKPGIQLEGDIMAALQLLEAAENPVLDMRIQAVDLANPDYLVAHFAYAGRVRRVKVAWEYMGERSDASRRRVMQKLGALKQALDDPSGHDRSHWLALIDGQVTAE